MPDGADNWRCALVGDLISKGAIGGLLLTLLQALALPTTASAFKDRGNDQVRGVRGDWR
jgi:hypothetical protein